MIVSTVVYKAFGTDRYLLSFLFEDILQGLHIVWGKGKGGGGRSSGSGETLRADLYIEAGGLESD